MSFNRWKFKFFRLLQRAFEVLFKIVQRFFFSSSWIKNLFHFFIFCFLFTSLYLTWIFLSLPRLVTRQDYKPPLLTEVYDRNEEKIGEFFKERRLLLKYEDIPKSLVEAFVAAEDGQFFEHGGINYRAILRAFLANLKAGRKVQGGSTITQQVARTLLLSSKKTYTRKLKEVILALRMEKTFSKQDILYVYLNQIYLGHGAYGVEMASQIYFKKSVQEINKAEAALLAGLPKAPSRFSPIFYPVRAKSRQIYVLNRMREEGSISEQEFKEFLAQPIKVYVREKFSEHNPYFLETVRRLLRLHFESTDILQSGLKIITSLDSQKQIQAQAALKQGLENIDKRQGFRGVQKNLTLKKERDEFVQTMKKKLRKQLRTHLIIPGFDMKLLDASTLSQDNLENLFKDIKEAKEEMMSVKNQKAHIQGKVFQALVSEIYPDRIKVLSPFGVKEMLLKDFDWAVPVDKKETQEFLNHPGEIFKMHDVISVKAQIKPQKEKEEEKPEETQPEEEEEPDIALELYQEPLVEGALLSFDLETSDIVALVGGYSYLRSQFNRAYQARRQPGSVFKPFVYGSALERGFNPASIISDAPVIFSDEEAEEKENEEKEAFLNSSELLEAVEEKGIDEIWRPSNISNRFSGDILFRTALIRSLNVPTVKVIKKVGLNWVRFFVRRLGVFSPLNSDFTMALGSSALTVYEVLKAFSVFPREGERITPILIHEVRDRFEETIITDLSLDDLFREELEETYQFVQEEADRYFPNRKEVLAEAAQKEQEREQAWAQGQEEKEEEKEDQKDRDRNMYLSLFEEESTQALTKIQAYIMNSLLESVIYDSEGTGRRASVLKRPLGGKTGTTNGYYDAWFMGFSPFISTGVWVGFDKERTLGRGETGSRAALPIWMEYMKTTHEEFPVKGFSIPERIVFVNIDGETGGLVSSKTKKIVRQAFEEGTEPHSIVEKNSPKETDKEESVQEIIPPLDQDETDESDYLKGDLSD